VHVYNSKLFTLKVKYTTYQCSVLTTVLSIYKQIMASNLHVFRPTLMLGKITHTHTRSLARSLARAHAHTLQFTNQATNMFTWYISNYQTENNSVIYKYGVSTQGSQSTLFDLLTLFMLFNYNLSIFIKVKK